MWHRLASAKALKSATAGSAASPTPSSSAGSLLFSLSRPSSISAAAHPRRWQTAQTADAISQQQSEQQQHQPTIIQNFIRSVQSKSPRDAIAVYRNLSRSDLIRDLAYWDLHQYVVLLCNQLNRVSASFALPPKLLSNLVEQVVADIRRHPKRYHLSGTLYPVLMRFYCGAGKVEDALALANEMQDKQIPHTVQSLTSLVICYEKLGQWEDCVRVYRQAVQEFNDGLGDNGDKFILHRTMIKVFGKQNNLEEAAEIVEQVLARPQTDEQTRSLVHLAFLDACVLAANQEKFVETLELLKQRGIEQQNVGHVFLGLARLGRWADMLKYMQEAHRHFRPFDGQFAPKSSDPVVELLDSSIETRRTGFPSSAFTDVMHALADRLRVDAPSSDSATNQKETIEMAERVFDLYEQQVVDTLERYRALGAQLKYQSEDAVFKQPRNPALRVLKVPYLQLYSIVMRNNSMYLALARVYLAAGRLENAVDAIKRGAVYHGYGEQQLINVFGESVFQAREDLKAVCSGQRVVSG